MKKLTYLVLLACLLSLMIPMNVFARPEHGTQINYFSSAAKTTLVGQRCYDCYSDSWESWGIKTTYITSDDNENCGAAY